MIKLIFLIAVIICTGVSLWVYLDFKNKSLPEEHLQFSLDMKNITRVYDAELNLNFINEKIEFKSKLKPVGDQIILTADADGFVKQDQCDDNLVVVSMNGTSFLGRTFHDNYPFNLTEYAPVNFIELTRTCYFQYQFVPNGDFNLLLSNQTDRPLSIDNLTFTTKFDDKKYQCREVCIFTKQMHYSDSDNNKNIRTVTLEEKNLSEKRLYFSLRTNDRGYQSISDTAYALFIGLIMAALSIGFDLVKNIKKRINFKNESSFFLVQYFTSGFVIWSIILQITEEFKHEIVFREFRNFLWQEQFFIVIFVPIIAQAFLHYDKRLRINRAVRTIRSKYALILFVVFLGPAILPLAYTSFFADTLFIITKDYPAARNPQVNFAEFTLQMAIFGYSLSIISVVIERALKYFIDNNDVEAFPRNQLNSKNKSIIVVSLFLISLFVFFFNDIVNFVSNLSHY